MGAHTSFLSYSHDSQHHIAAAIALADRLSRQGVPTSLDKYQDSPAEGWPKWMERQIREATYVLVVCSKLYKEKYEHPNPAGLGLGVKWESLLVVQRLHDAGALNKALVPICFNPADTAFIITPLSPFTCYKPFTSIDPEPVWNEEEYTKLYRFLTKQPEYVQPNAGPIQELPPKNSVAGKRSDPTVAPVDVEPSPYEAPPESGESEAESAGSAGGVAVLTGQVDVQLTLDKPWHQHTPAEKKAVLTRLSRILDVSPSLINIVNPPAKGGKGDVQ